ncbi:hypothetical protein AAER75_27625, partial [Klebsiella pneumoniae]
RQQAEKRGLTPRMRIRGWAVAGCGAEIMGFGPSPATRRLMDRLNIDVQSIDLIELNEAFAAQALAVMNDLRLDPARVNVNGGAIALGPPGGALSPIHIRPCRRTLGFRNLGRMVLLTEKRMATASHR